MNFNDRRSFLKSIGLLSASPLIINYLSSCSSGNNENKEQNINEGFSEFGIQIWTVKEDMAIDPKATLKKLADAGYNYVESFGGDNGIFWGMQAKEFKSYLDEVGLNMYSAHCNSNYTLDLALEDEFKKLADDAASIGMTHLINPFPGELSKKDEWEKVVAGLNRQAEICTKSGIKMGYHNHHIEFLPLEDGTLPENMLLDGTTTGMVDFELDIYWAIKAGQNPEEWLKKHNDRYKLVHVKDLYSKEKVEEIEATEGPQEDFWPLGASCVVGTGRINFPEILSVARDNGVIRYIVEQERFDNSTPLEDSVKDAAYMKAFKFA